VNNSPKVVSEAERPRLELRHKSDALTTTPYTITIKFIRDILRQNPADKQASSLFTMQRAEMKSLSRGIQLLVVHRRIFTGKLIYSNFLIIC